MVKNGSKMKPMVLGFGILLTSILLIGITYAFWRIVLKQENANVLVTGCFNVTLTESNAIEIGKALPISDSEGKQLTPYIFTIKNTCRVSASYQVNLEVLDNSTLASDYVKAVLNDGVPKLLTNYETADINISNAKESYKLTSGDLTVGASITYELRLWLGEEITDQVFEKSFISKIAVVTAVAKPKSLADRILALYNLNEENYFSHKAPIGLLNYIDPDEWESIITTTNYNSNYWIGTDYIYDESSGRYTLSGTLSKGITSENPKIGQYTILRSEETQSDFLIYKIIDYVSETKFKGSKKTGTERRNYDPFDSGIHALEDDYGTSYAFRGYIEYLNVNVILGDYRWKIVRIDGRGNIRLIYVGHADEYYATGKFPIHKNDPIDYYEYNNLSGSMNDFKYMNSKLKTFVDDFYDNLSENIKSKIVDSIYCNDLSIDNEKSNENYTYFKINGRLHEPTLKCLSEEGSLVLPIGVITADELIIAGIQPYDFSDSYLSFKNQWTMTPHYFGNGYPFIWLEEADFLVENLSDSNSGVYPVITISSEVEFEGSGTAEDPYIIKN